MVWHHLRFTSMNSETGQSGFRRRLRTSPPKVLYTYRSIDARLWDSLKKKQIWASDPLSFNDPFDCNLPICRMSTPEKALASVLPLVQNPHPITKAEVIREAQRGEIHCADEIIAGWRKQMSATGVTCFCEAPNDILMWSHYASKHQGVCLGFEKLQNRLDVQRVEYSKVLPTIELSDLLSPNGLPSMVNFILTKSDAWSYEREWRFFLGAQPFSSPDDPNRKIQFHPDELRRVIFGCRIKSEHRDELICLLRNWPRRIHLYDAVIHPSQFRLQLRAIEV